MPWKNGANGAVPGFSVMAVEEFLFGPRVCRKPEAGHGVAHDCPDRAQQGENCTAWCGMGFSCDDTNKEGAKFSEGATLPGCHEMLVCQRDGNFRGPFPVCKKDCAGGLPSSFGPEYVLVDPQNSAAAAPMSPRRALFLAPSPRATLRPLDVSRPLAGTLVHLEPAAVLGCARLCSAPLCDWC